MKGVIYQGVMHSVNCNERFTLVSVSHSEQNHENKGENKDVMVGW